MNRGQREGWHAAAQLMGKEPECCGRKDAQEQLMGKEPECCGRKDAQEQPACHHAHRTVGLLCLVLLPFAGLSADQSKLYEVRDGNKVDTKTLNGWKTWRALACERCHGAEQEGLVGPSLIESLKVLSKEDFHTLLMEGRMDKGMPAFKTSQMVNDNWEGLYAYLKGRSDGAIQPGRLSPLNE